MGSQRSRSGTASSGDYFGPNQGPAFSPFPSGTPPPHPSQLPNGYQPNTPENQSQYNGFHPYRRPQRHGSHSQDPQQVAANGDWRSVPQHPGAFQPPYARSDAAGSSTSVNSGSTHSHSPRQRTNSAQGSTSGGSVVGSQSNPKVASTTSHGRGGSTTSANSQASGAPPPRIHHRTGSTSSSASSTVRPAATSSGSTSSVPHGTSTLRKPSPLSQGTFTAAEKRMSRDDSDLTTMLEPAPGVRSGGLKGRLRRALSLNANGVLHEEEEEDLAKHAMPRPSISTLADDESTATVQKKKSRSLFNSRLNRSTDNISLSSTMSSASMVIRKLGSIGKLARRNSLAGITSLFKDKKDKDDEEGGGKKGKKKKGEKGSAADPSVSHATAELDRSDWTASADLAGLSPAARLARQHTLKSNAEAAAKAKAEQEARAAAAAASVAQTQANGEVLPATWEKNTTNRQGENIHGKLGPRVNEAGMRVVVEDDDSDSWDDDEEWGEAQDDEDVTIRQSIDGPGMDEDMEPWAINVRRSIERTRVPTKGILKTRVDGRGYEQDTFLQHPNPAFNRTRSNSYDSSPAHD
ncbi:hypothetical protein A0H81_00216 [Grifola frondosa]|uniref:Uncharacterized protein n=1 Tax=Grifola frondosa TaxID=5627 RepID=A0A1C7MNV0_GRIFR|nr:hypothetical protein A0H81_00216 [Grifola frondosa]